MRADAKRSNQPRSWRLKDLMVANTLAVVYGLMFIAWSYLFVGLKPILTALFGIAGFGFLGQELLIGFWFGAGVLVPYLVRRPGAAFLGATVAALVEMPFIPWGFAALLSGLLQGAASELPFFLTRYRSYRWPVLMMAATLPALSSFAIEYVPYGYASFPLSVRLLTLGVRSLSGLVLGGIFAKKLADRLLIGLAELAEYHSPVAQRLEANSPTDSKLPEEKESNTMIQLEDVSIQYPNQGKPSLKHVSFRIHSKETVLLLGPSGSGKSTLALSMNGLIPQRAPSTVSGRIRVAGLDTQHTEFSLLSQKVGLLFQDPESCLTAEIVEEEVAFGLENIGIPKGEMEIRVEQALKKVGLFERKKDPTEILSLGEKQRLVLASIFALRPNILVLDEPTAFLDPLGTKQILNLLKEMKEDLTLVMIEHKLDDVLSWADRVVVLGEDGTQIAQGEPHEVFTKHIDTFLKMGVFVPQVSFLAHRLQEAGILFHPLPITVEEAVASLRLHLPSLPREQIIVSPSPMIPSTQNVVPPQEEPPSPQKESLPLLEIRELSYDVSGRMILDHLSLSVSQGEFLALVGHNGAGKTTLLRHIASDIQAGPGRIWLDQKDFSSLSLEEKNKAVGFVFQNPEHQFLQTTVEEELLLGLRLRAWPEQEVQIILEKLLVQFQLNHIRKANPFRLSEGQKRRLSIATMIGLGQRILILDEPTIGLDQRNILLLFEMLQRLHQEGKTIIFITHDMNLVAAYATKVAVLSEGVLRFHGSKEILFRHQKLLTETQLSLPPLAELSHRLACLHPAWQDLWTLSDWEQAYGISKPLSSQLNSKGGL